MRLFVAFTFTDEFRAELVKAGRALRRLGVSGGFTRRLALSATFCGRKLRGCFICFCRQDCRPGDAGLSSEDLHKAEKTNGQHR